MSFIGRKAGVGFKKETTRGTAEASAGIFIPYTSLSADDVPEKIMDEASIGVLVNSVDDAVGVKRAEISIEGKAEAISIGDILLQALGQVSSANNGDSTYTHTFSFLNDTHPSYTLFKSDPIQSMKYALAMLSKVDFNIQLGQYFLFTAEYIAKAGATATVSPTYATTQYNWLPQHASVKFADTIAGLSGATAICSRVVNLSIEKGLVTEQCLGSQDYNDIFNGQVQISGSLELVFKTDQYRQWLMNDTKKVLRIEVDDAGTIIGSGTRTPKLQMDLYNVKVQSSPVSYEQSELATVTVEFNGYYSVSDAEIMKAYLTNTQATY